MDLSGGWRVKPQTLVSTLHRLLYTTAPNPHSTLSPSPLALPFTDRTALHQSFRPWGSMLTIVTRDLESPTYNSNPLDRLGFEKSDVSFTVDRAAFIGHGAFMNCYEAKVLVGGEVREMVAKQAISRSNELDSYQGLSQCYLEAEQMIEVFKMVVKSEVHAFPQDMVAQCQKIRLVTSFIVHQGCSDEPDPKEIYFFEERIPGIFHKFSGNLFFGIEENKQHKLIYEIMHTLVHKSYHNNFGTWMIADLQGNEDGLLTDIAIIDEEYPWTMGNTD